MGDDKVFQLLEHITEEYGTPRLALELVPATCWYSNVRSIVTVEQWDFLRRATYAKANYTCELCGGRGERHPVECHEIWHYDDVKLVQSLTRLVSLCPACHEVKHMGLARLNGREAQALAHLAKVNEWDLEKAEGYCSVSFDIFTERSKKLWSLDVGWLSQYGIYPKKERR